MSRSYRLRSDRPEAEVLSHFAERSRSYGAQCSTVSCDDIGETIAAALRTIGADRVSVPADLPASWRSPGTNWFEDGGGSSVDLDRVDAAVSGCAVAIADTGTVVLDGGVGQGRRALTLLPDYHLCVVRTEQVVDLLPEALERLGPAAKAGSPITFISGCSATSDIELERVGGVHGPRILELLLVRA
ncbi:MAG: lactate utilization protein C [Solirubrobacterales bacterium]